MCQHLIPQIQHSKILIGIHKPVYVDAKVSPATISELNKKAYVPIEDWRNRPLQGGKYPYVYVDGIYLRRNWGGEYENVAVLWVLRQNSACRAPTAGKHGRQGVIRPAVRPGSAAAFFGQRGGAAAHHGQHIHRHQQLGEGHGEPDGPRIEQQQSLLVKENHCQPGQAFQTILAFEAENLAIVQRCPSPS